MKKFLSVLLALAVAFTFTFGSTMSAFAVYNATSETKVTLYDEAEKALKEELGNVDTAKAAFLQNYPSDVTIADWGGSGDSVTISKDAAKLLVDDASEALKAAITAAYNQQVIVINGGTFATADTLAEAVTAVTTPIHSAGTSYATTANFKKILMATAISGVTLPYTADQIVEKEFDVKKEAALTEIGKAEATLSNYSTAIPEEKTVTVDGVDKYLPIADVAKLMLTTAKEKIDVVFDATAKETTYTYMTGFTNEVNKVVYVDKDGKYAVKAAAFTKEAGYSADITVASSIVASGLIISTEAADKNNKTVAEEKAYQIEQVKGKLALAKATVRKALNAELTANVNNATKVAAINKALARIDADYAAVEEVAIAQINYAKTVGEATTYGTAWTTGSEDTPAKINTIDELTETYPADSNYVATGTIEAYVTKCTTVDNLEAKAAEMKAMTGLDGKPCYDADAVDKALEKDIKAVYTGGSATFLDALETLTDVVKAERTAAIGAANNKTIVIDKVTYPNIYAWEEKATETNVSTGALVNYDEDNSDAVLAIAEETKAAVRAAATVADVDAAFLAGYAKFSAVKTLSDLSTYQTKKETRELVSAYTAKLTAALETKKAEYGTTKFAKDYESTGLLVGNLVNEYLATAYDNAGLEAGYQEALKVIDELWTKAQLAAEQKAINDEILTLKSVTLADEAKVVALAKREADFADYKTLIGVVSGYTTYGVTSYVSTVKALAQAELQKAVDAIGTVTVEDEDAIKALEEAVDTFIANYDEEPTLNPSLATIKNNLVGAKVAALEKAIGAIDASADPVDAAAVKAAREAYDALGEVGINEVYYQKLLSLETLVASQKAAYTDVNAKADLLDMSRKLTIWRTSKTSIKVTAVGSVKNIKANGYTVKYSFYKKAPGATSYKLVKTTTSNKYTYTNLKKGTNKFQVKVVVKDADGKVVASKWTYYRAAKIK